jgi:hypothetical protein
MSSAMTPRKDKLISLYEKTTSAFKATPGRDN